MNKYHAVKTTVDGNRFDSKAEAVRYKELKLLEKAGRIKGLRLQPRFELQPKFRYNGKTERKIEYVGDFLYLDVSQNKWVVEDVKGMETDVFKLKRKLFLFKYGDSYIFKIVR